MKTRFLHHVRIAVFCKPHDDQQAVLHGLDCVSPIPMSALLAVVPEHDVERPHTRYYRLPNIDLTVQETQTDEGKMTIYTLFFKKIHDVNQFARRLVAAFTPEERAAFENDPASLLDLEGHVTCRLDKELLMREKWSLTDDGNCYQVKAAVAAYPKNHDVIVEVLGTLLRA